MTAKAATEGLTRALVVDYGLLGIRTNAEALGSIIAERHEAYLEEQEPDTARRIENEMRHLLPEDAGFVNGATAPVDGGRSALAVDPEAPGPVR